MWSAGDLGQLGNGDRNSSVVPVPVESLDDAPVVQISLGTAHNAVLLSGGEVLTWGHGVGGRLGHGDEDDQLVPTPVAGLATVKVAQVCRCWGRRVRSWADVLWRFFSFHQLVVFLDFA